MEGEEGRFPISNTDPDEPPEYGKGWPSVSWPVTIKDKRMLAEGRGVHDTHAPLLKTLKPNRLMLGAKGSSVFTELVLSRLPGSTWT